MLRMGSFGVMLFLLNFREPRLTPRRTLRGELASVWSRLGSVAALGVTMLRSWEWVEAGDWGVVF